MPDENGETRRQRHKRFQQPDPPHANPPPGASYLWEWFWELSNRRLSGPEPLTFSEIDAWARINRIPIRPDEVKTLTVMDDAYLSEVRKEQAAALERARNAT